MSRDSEFTKLTPAAMRRTLGQRLVPVADRLRDILTQFGLRPYTVTLMTTRWTGGRRGVGEEIVLFQTPLLPTPRITDLTGVNAVATAAGLAELGEILLSRISGAYADEQLRGIAADGRPADASDQFFYEVHFPRIDGQPGERRRFFPNSAPYYDATALQWRVHLRKQEDGRQRSGDMRR